MTAPVWMASPPEVHSALLSSGPGPTGLLAASGAWSSLSAAFAETTDELTAILAAVQAGSWEGPSAAQYVTAHVPYLAWLMRASANSAVVAAQHETAATAYTAALAAMPTLPELAANHAVHAVLVATNFFGINTIPIALNEADYARMWIQAATTMTTYQAISTAAVESAPQTDPSPAILHADDSGDDSGDDGGDDGNIIDDDSGTPYDLSWWVNRITEITKTLGRDLGEFQTNPSQAISDLLTDIPALVADEWSHLLEVFQAFPGSQALLFALPAASLGGFASPVGLTALAAIQPEAAPVPAAAAAPMPEAPSLPVPSSSPAVIAAPAAAPTPSSAPLSAPAPAPTSVPATGAPPPPPAGIEGAAYPYLVGAARVGSSTGLSSSAQRKGSEPDSAAAAAAAAASAQEKRRARRRRRTTMRGYGDEFMDMNVEVDPDWGGLPGEEPVVSAAASGQGAGTLGFAGTAREEAKAAAAGLTTLAGDDFGGGPSLPMLPGTWKSDQREPGEPDQN
jgi:PPE-repeat protein